VRNDTKPVAFDDNITSLRGTHQFTRLLAARAPGLHHIGTSRAPNCCLHRRRGREPPFMPAITTTSTATGLIHTVVSSSRGSIATAGRSLSRRHICLGGGSEPPRLLAGLDRVAGQDIECGHSRNSSGGQRVSIFGVSIIKSLFQPAPKGAWLTVAGTHRG
jgi:hypothetical protein